MRIEQNRLRAGFGGLVMVMVFLCAGRVAVRAQDATGGETAKPAAMPKDADPDWEVATVKPSDPNDTAGEHVRYSGRHLVLLNHTVEEILLVGYGMQKSQILAEPGWVKTERWDVDGVPDMEGQPSMTQLQGMMRKILSERFGLKLHHEQRELPVFALTVANGGPKLTSNVSAPNGLFERQVGGGSGWRMDRLKNASMSDLALVLQFNVDRPVVDQTGLKGRYDFTLQWTFDESRAPTDGSAPPSLSTAMQEQLGLKLEATRALADVLVIDKVERPGAN